MKLLRKSLLATLLVISCHGLSAAMVTVDYLDYTSKPTVADYGNFPSPNLCEVAIHLLCDKYELILIDYDASLWGNDWNNVASASLTLWLSEYPITLGTDVAVLEAIELSAPGTYIYSEVSGLLPAAYGPIDVLGFLKTGFEDAHLSALLKAEHGHFEYHQAVLSISYDDGLNPPSEIPEPGTLLLMGLGLLGLSASRKLRVA